MVVVPAEFGEMLAGSETVVHGRVVDVRSYDTAGRKTIETRITVQVIESLKGDAGQVVYFRVPGGQVGRYRRVMVGAPSFTAGEELVLFLRGRAPVVPQPFGLTQGVYRVARDAAGRGTVAPMMQQTPGRITRGDPARRPFDIQAFTAMVRSMAESPR
jgi:hypothetical protein